VGFIGHSYTAFWARLARLRIVADMPSQHAARFWGADGERQWAVLRAFAATGATAVVSQSAPREGIPPGWIRVGDTGYLVYRLP
jgi:hypothetical protein